MKESVLVLVMTASEALCVSLALEGRAREIFSKKLKEAATHPTRALEVYESIEGLPESYDDSV